MTRFIAYANFFLWNFTTKDETCEVHFQEGDYELNLECLFAISICFWVLGFGQPFNFSS